jgi:hypothetical protein
MGNLALGRAVGWLSHVGRVERALEAPSAAYTPAVVGSLGHTHSVVGFPFVTDVASFYPADILPATHTPTAARSRGHTEG